MIRVTNSRRVDFQYLLQKLAHDGKVRLTVARRNKPVALDVLVATNRALLIPDLRREHPSYSVYGPLVFFTATAQFFAGTDDILGDNGVRSQGSPDTLAIWNARPAP